MSGGPVPIWLKYTSRSKGIWEKIRQLLVLVPNRSTGNPLPSLYRFSPPGDRIEAAKNYEDPVSIPTGDIKGNPYYKRDYRRNYPQVRAFDQTKVAGLLKLGSAEKPRISIGNKGSQELQAFTDPSAPMSLSAALNTTEVSVLNGEVLGETGEPIVAPSLNFHKWTILSEPQHGMYNDSYPIRIFTEDRSGKQ